MTTPRSAVVPVAVSFALLIATSCALPQPPEIKFDVDSFARPSTRCNMRSRALADPHVGLPAPRNDDLVKLRDRGDLRKAIDIMAARGFVASVEMGWAWTPAGAMAMAKTLQKPSSRSV